MGRHGPHYNCCLVRAGRFPSSGAQRASPFVLPAPHIPWVDAPAKPAIICRSTQQSFLRLTSSPALLKAYGAEGFTNRDALAALEALRSLPQVCEREGAPGRVALWHRLGTRDTASPKLWMDACLAAFAIRGALALVMTDSDFKTFVTHGRDLHWLNA